MISINPYKVIPKLYDHPETYLSKVEALNKSQFYDSLVKLPPHVYGIANRSLRWLITSSHESLSQQNNSINQSIIISGESGAGILKFVE